jgi:polar amino acid transport system substrate-binding protein
MKQVAQHNRSGAIRVLDVPAPTIRRGFVLVRTHVSVISAGTERASVESRQSSLVDRARKNPDLVAAVLEQVRQFGLVPTVRRVRGKLDSWSALGYSTAGTVIAVGDEVDHVRPGDRVACAGAGYANHAEFVLVPKNLCVRIPAGVDLEEAAYTTIGTIALQGVRQAMPTIGETVVVIGLGLIGQITVQLLKANGCAVIGIDLDPAAVALSRKSGADAALHRSKDDVKKAVLQRTGGRGADAVIITAATRSDDPVQLAGDICRDKGRVVLVGDVMVPDDMIRATRNRVMIIRSALSGGPNSGTWRSFFGWSRCANSTCRS